MTLLLIKLKKFFNSLLQVKINNEERRRQTLILNILLLSSIIFLIGINIIRAIDTIKSGGDRGLSLIVTILILLFFSGLFYISRRGKSQLATYLFIGAYYLPTFYFAYRWGADLPAVLLLSVLVIIMSGVLISANFAWVSTGIVSLVLFSLTYLQFKGYILLNSYWRAERHETSDMISYIIIFGVIAAVAWLYAREIEKSLKRAHLSEQALREERDSLEVKVQERTKQIRELEMDKITQLYRLAEFGRLSSGIFHDLINPLTAVGLSLEQIKNDPNFKSTNNYLEQAFRATGKMENFIKSLKKQITGTNSKKYFSVNSEINETLQILSYKIIKSKVSLDIKVTNEVQLYGDPLKFGQIIANLISNATEACLATNDGNRNKIKLNVSTEKEKTTIKISDNGIGIKPENRDNIWEAFFSTKNGDDCGLGIGLASVKNIIEKDFNGKIDFTSDSMGTSFYLEFPHLSKN